MTAGSILSIAFSSFIAGFSTATLLQWIQLLWRLQHYLPGSIGS